MISQYSLGHNKLGIQVLHVAEMENFTGKISMNCDIDVEILIVKFDKLNQPCIKLYKEWLF